MSSGKGRRGNTRKVTEREIGAAGVDGNGGVNGKKMAHHDKKFCLTSYIRKCASYDHMIVAFSTPA